MEVTTSDLVGGVARDAGTRLELWASFLERTGARTVAEIGVYRGDFAAHVLGACPGIETYYMIDPWRQLPDWNKPANRRDQEFERIFDRAMETTGAWAGKRVVLRGRTVETVHRIPDATLDLAYVDGDHTLRGIAIDLISLYPKVREGGWIGGDDFSRSIWQHGEAYEPTLVFPFAVHFAEAVGAWIYALPHNQFLIPKRADRSFRFVDFTGGYGPLDLRSQLTGR